MAVEHVLNYTGEELNKLLDKFDGINYDSANINALLSEISKLTYNGDQINALLASVEALAAKLDNSMLTIDNNANGKILRVVNGKWTAVAVDVYNGEVL
jgi:hypothetical protein